MAAINGVKKSSVVKKAKGKDSGKGKKVIVITVLISILLTLLTVAVAWKFEIEDRMYDKFLVESKAGQSQALRALRDIAPGESIDGAVETVEVPGNLVISNALPSNVDTANLRASGTIVANALITNNNTYNPITQDIVLATSRQVDVDYLETPGINEGDYVDIRLKVYRDNSSDTYKDEIVCAKKEILYKDMQGSIELMLSESEILNLNSAVVEAVDQTHTAKLYVTKYVDPANQPKAQVTYTGKGIQYTQEELAEAQNRLKAIQLGEGEYSSPEVNRESPIDEENMEQNGEEAAN